MVGPTIRARSETLKSAQPPRVRMLCKRGDSAMWQALSDMNRSSYVRTGPGGIGPVGG